MKVVAEDSTEKVVEIPQENFGKIHKIFFFSSGRQIIAKVERSKKTKKMYWLEPMVILLQQNPQRQGIEMGFQPFPLSIYLNETKWGPINEKDALLSVTPDQRLIENYEKQCAVIRAAKAGITIAPAGAEKRIKTPPPGEKNNSKLIV